MIASCTSSFASNILQKKLEMLDVPYVLICKDSRIFRVTGVQCLHRCCEGGRRRRCLLELFDGVHALVEYWFFCCLRLHGLKGCENLFGLIFGIIVYWVERGYFVTV